MQQAHAHTVLLVFFFKITKNKRRESCCVYTLVCQFLLFCSSALISPFYTMAATRVDILGVKGFVTEKKIIFLFQVRFFLFFLNNKKNVLPKKVGRLRKTSK